MVIPQPLGFYLGQRTASKPESRANASFLFLCRWSCVTAGRNSYSNLIMTSSRVVIQGMVSIIPNSDGQLVCVFNECKRDAEERKRVENILSTPFHFESTHER